MSALRQNDSWEIVDSLKDKNYEVCKNTFTIKCNANGSVWAVVNNFT